MAGDSDSSEASCYYTRSLQLFRFIFESLFVILFIIELVIRWASLKRSDTCNHCNHCNLLESHWFLTSQHVIFQAINFLSWWMEYLWRDRWILRLVEVNCAALISGPHSESSQLTPAGLLSSFADFYVVKKAAWHNEMSYFGSSCWPRVSTASSWAWLESVGRPAFMLGG